MNRNAIGGSHARMKPPYRQKSNTVRIAWVKMAQADGTKVIVLTGEIRRNTQGNGNRRYTLKAALILRKSAEIRILKMILRTIEKMSG